MEKTKNRALKLGIFVILSAIVLVITVYLIGQKKDIFSNTFTLKVEFGNVGGLQPGNNVRLSGINVGSVLSVEIQNDSTIEVMLRIREDVQKHIKQNAVATIGTDGLMGNMLVNISPGRGEAEIVKDGDLIKSYSRIKTDDILNTLTTTNENAALLTSDLLEIVQKMSQGKGTISYLINDTILQQQVFLSIQNVRMATEKTNEFLSELKEVTEKINNGQGLAGWLVNDTLTQRKIATTLAGLEATSTKINASADSLSLLINDLARGKGAIPTLMKDTIMANELRQILKNVNEGTSKFNEDMEALQHNFLFKKYFKEKEKKN